mgnify:CR=1 FL=1
MAKRVSDAAHRRIESGPNTSRNFFNGNEWDNRTGSRGREEVTVDQMKDMLKEVYGSTSSTNFNKAKDAYLERYGDRAGDFDRLGPAGQRNLIYNFLQEEKRMGSRSTLLTD